VVGKIIYFITKKEENRTITLFRYMRIRFRANNPGVWLFHCHTEFHLDRGMAVMIHVSHIFIYCELFEQKP
jgi:FtsP/CotA-like multicopper oxidase with cupredoxin domain